MLFVEALLKSGGVGLAGSPEDGFVKKVGPEVEGCVVVGLAGGLSSDFSGDALPRVNEDAEAPGVGPKNDVCLLAVSLVDSEDVEGGANENVGGLASGFASAGVVMVIVGTDLAVAAAAAAASAASLSLFSFSAFSLASFSFSFSACFFILASLIFIIAFASRSCFSHLENVL